MATGPHFVWLRCIAIQIAELGLYSLTTIEKRSVNNIKRNRDASHTEDGFAARNKMQNIGFLTAVLFALFYEDVECHQLKCKLLLHLALILN